MIKYIVTLVLLTCFYQVQSQSVDALCFRWSEQGHVYPDYGIENPIPFKNDIKNKDYAIIKVMTSETGLKFDFGDAGKALGVIVRKGEIWLLAPKGAQSINIINFQNETLCNYQFGTDLEEDEVYTLVLKTGQNQTLVTKQLTSKWLIIRSTPLSASISIDGLDAGTTPYYGSLTLGTHNLRMESQGETKEKKINLTNSSNQQLVMQFKPLIVHKNTNEERALIDYEWNPEFPGGYEGMLKFIHDKMHYPERAKELSIQGTVFVQFYVSITGRISNVKVLRGIGAGCDEEAVRIVKLMPKWLPARKHPACHIL